MSTDKQWRDVSRNLNKYLMRNILCIYTVNVLINARIKCALNPENGHLRVNLYARVIFK